MKEHKIINELDRMASQLTVLKTKVDRLREELAGLNQPAPRKRATKKNIERVLENRRRHRLRKMARADLKEMEEA